MEVKMRPVRIEEIPGMCRKRPHDEWAKEAVRVFADSGEQAVELTVPKFNVGYQTVLCLLRQYATPRKVKVRSVKADAPARFRTFLYRKGA